MASATSHKWQPERVYRRATGVFMSKLPTLGAFSSSTPPWESGFTMCPMAPFRRNSPKSRGDSPGPCFTNCLPAGIFQRLMVGYNGWMSRRKRPGTCARHNRPGRNHPLEVRQKFFLPWYSPHNIAPDRKPSGAIPARVAWSNQKSTTSWIWYDAAGGRTRSTQSGPAAIARRKR